MRARAAVREAAVDAGRGRVDAAARDVLDGAVVDVTARGEIGEPVVVVVHYRSRTNLPLIGALVPGSAVDGESGDAEGAVMRKDERGAVTMLMIAIVGVGLVVCVAVGAARERGGCRGTGADGRRRGRARRCRSARARSRRAGRAANRGFDRARERRPAGLVHVCRHRRRGRGRDPRSGPGAGPGRGRPQPGSGRP